VKAATSLIYISRCTVRVNSDAWTGRLTKNMNLHHLRLIIIVYSVTVFKICMGINTANFPLWFSSWQCRIQTGTQRISNAL